MAKSILLEQENSFYESPKLDVIEIAAKDIVCTSPVDSEGGDNYNDAWL